MTDPVDQRARRALRDNFLAAASFTLGGSLFAAGAFLAGTGAELLAVNLTYLVGGVFFSLGGGLSVLATRVRSLGWWSALVLFVGTLLFAVSLVAAFAEGLTPRQSDTWIWFPDMAGCVCFLVAGHLAMLDVGHGRVRVLPRERDWWIAAVNQLGSVLFILAGVAAFVRPATSTPVDVALVNWGTFAGAVCFAVAGVVQMLPAPTAPAVASSS
ncbi:MAG: hypothetical protein ACJ72P_08085 [Nocardioides sp.]